MKNFRAADKSHAGGDEKHDINFHWPNCRFASLTKYAAGVEEGGLINKNARSSMNEQLPLKEPMYSSRRVAQLPRGVILAHRGVKTPLLYKTTLPRSQNYPSTQGTEMTP